MQNLTKARKTHTCVYCDREIRPGEMYEYGKGRGPAYDDNDEQSGIQYWEYHLCGDTARCIERGENCGQSMPKAKNVPV